MHNCENDDQVYFEDSLLGTICLLALSVISGLGLIAGALYLKWKQEKSNEA